MLTLAFVSPAFATVVVSSPTNGETVGSSAKFAASASTGCSKGVAAMGVYVDNGMVYKVNGNNINTSLALTSGTHYVVVQDWDFCGGSTKTPLTITVSDQAGVSVASPASGSTVTSVVPYVATASTSCRSGVVAMGVYVGGQLKYVSQGAKLNTQISLGAGTQQTTVNAWDYCGQGFSKAVVVTVAGGASGGGKTIPNLQAAPGWNQWGELAPSYNICSPCSGVNWSMYQHVSSGSLSGNATKFNIGGSTPYSDVLWSNPVIGQGNQQGLTDQNHTLLPTLHDFTLDTSVYITNLSVTQDLEFDINMYENGVGMEWGTQCNHLADGAWDLWDNVNAHWFSSGVPCRLNNQAWNHVVVQVQRESNNDLLYQTITVNGVTSNINRTVAPFSVPGGWWGMTVNYQMDGNYKQSAYATVVDNMNFTYR